MKLNELIFRLLSQYNNMENSIKIYDFLGSPLAVSETKGTNIWNKLVQTIQWEIKLDFTDMRVVISPFIRSMLRPLLKSWIKFQWINFPNKMDEETYKRVIEEFERIWTESIKEISL